MFKILNFFIIDANTAKKLQQNWIEKETKKADKKEEHQCRRILFKIWWNAIHGNSYLTLPSEMVSFDAARKFREMGYSVKYSLFFHVVEINWAEEEKVIKEEEKVIKED